jgi:hypothetical protein
MAAHNGREVQLPPRLFLYTMDQVAVILDVTIDQVRQHLAYYEGRSVGRSRKEEIRFRNIAAPDEKPDWRVTEHDLVRWLKFKGYKFYDRGYIK